MKPQEFQLELLDILGIDESLQLSNANFSELLDSLRVLSIISLIDEYNGILCSYEEVSRCQTIEDLHKLARI